MKVDPSGVFDLSEDNLVGRGGSRSEVVSDDGELPIRGLDRILGAELTVKSSDGANKRQLCGEDADELSGPPSKSVASQLYTESGGLFSAG